MRVAGVDEAGRGPLAGPVVCAAVMLPDDDGLSGLNDSKKLNAAKRERLYDAIRSIALSYSIVNIDAESVDLCFAFHIKTRRDRKCFGIAFCCCFKCV